MCRLTQAFNVITRWHGGLCARTTRVSGRGESAEHHAGVRVTPVDPCGAVAGPMGQGGGSLLRIQRCAQALQASVATPFVRPGGSRFQRLKQGDAFRSFSRSAEHIPDGIVESRRCSVVSDLLLAITVDGARRQGDPLRGGTAQQGDCQQQDQGGDQGETCGADCLKRRRVRLGAVNRNKGFVCTVLADIPWGCTFAEDKAFAASRCLGDQHLHGRAFAAGRWTDHWTMRRRRLSAANSSEAPASVRVISA